MKKIILIGGGGHAVSCIEVIESIKSFEIIGIICTKVKKNIHPYKIIGEDKDLNKIKKNYKFAINCVGQIKSPEKRIKIYKKLKKLRFILPKIISSTAYVSKKSTIEEGSIIMNFAFINANVKIGKNSIINTRATIEHDVRIGSHCHISTGVIVNGGTSIGDGTFIGSGTIINENISIGKNCIIKSNSRINKNLESNTILK